MMCPHGPLNMSAIAVFCKQTLVCNVDRDAVATAVVGGCWVVLAKLDVGGCGGEVSGVS